MSESIICENYTTEQAGEAFAFNAEVKGHISYLDDGRIIFIGKHPDHKQWFIAFQSEEGKQTKLGLSYEAMAILVQLYNKPPTGTDTFPMVIKTAWRILMETEESPND